MIPQKTARFQYSFCAAGQTDIGRKRKENQDQIVLRPDLGFFAVSDGMGGVENGALSAKFVCESMPEMVRISLAEYDSHRDAEKAGAVLYASARLISDNLYRTGNSEKHILYGATLACVTLLEDRAVFIGLGDSRGYILPRYQKQLDQITEDHTIAALLVQNGEITPDQAKEHPASAQLTAFVGMQSPATPDLFSMEIYPGDRILLCSDGLYGLVSESEIVRILRSSRSPARVCKRLVDRANELGGRDNISVVYLKISH